ncbi:MAG: HAMP domain-containing sensor histidine kinase, partial [Leptolyngbyaceae bacterium]|nr:HAMP domain-containing sensor histidine kinase [Leptolyngbyaceae bacterium]
LSLAMEESERLQRLLNEILLYARDQQLSANELNLVELLTELWESLREMPYAVDRTIKFMATSDEVVVKGDRDKLKQVFINLVSNACEAIPSGETVSWKIECNGNPKQIQIQVHNGGEPIPPDVLPQLTKPFFTTKSSGNGLGLAITKRIVEAHDGTLSFTSTAEDGTTVTVVLPRVVTLRSTS